MVLAAVKSYILRYDHDSGKLPLYVNVQDTMCSDHRRVTEEILKNILDKELSKEEALTLRAKLVGRE